MSDKDFDFSYEIEEANWKLIAPHHERKAVFIISSDLDLAMVAKVMAKDDVVRVEGWLKSGQLRHPTELEIQHWESQKEEKIFNFVIVQPYVIIQLRIKNLH